MLVVVLLLLAWLFDSWDIILFRNLALLIVVILAIFDFVRSRIYKKKLHLPWILLFHAVF